MKIAMFFLIVAIVIIVGTKLKLNTGVIAVFAAFVSGALLLGKDSYGIISGFPGALFFNMMNPMIFYGFANSNGTMTRLAEHIMYRFRGAKKLMPIILFLTTEIISMLGAGTNANIIMTGVCFGVALQMGFNPILASMACWGGSIAGDMIFWSADCAFYKSFIEHYAGAEAAQAYVEHYFTVTNVFFWAVFLISYFALKGYKSSGSAVIKKPEKMNGSQKLTLIVILAVIALVVLPAFIDIIAPNPVTTWLITYVTIQPLCACGTIVLAIAKADDLRKILNEQVAWGALLMIAGMAMLMGLCAELGVLDLVAQYLQTASVGVILAVVAAAAAILSLFMNGGTIVNLFYPLAASVGAATGVPTYLILLACDNGMGASSFSPYSTGGALSLTGCPDADLREKLTNKQFIWGIGIGIAWVVFCGVGLLKIF